MTSTAVLEWVIQVTAPRKGSTWQVTARSADLRVVETKGKHLEDMHSEAWHHEPTRH